MKKIKFLFFVVLIAVITPGCNPFEEGTTGSYDRNILVEYFTATWCTNCEGVSQNLHKLEKEREDVVIVAYHPTDRDELGNEAGDRRYDFYDIDNVPTVIFDGLDRFVGGGTEYSQFTETCDEHSKEKSPLKISLNVDVKESIEVELILETEKSLSGRVYVLLDEDGLKSSGYDTLYDNVVRKDTSFEVSIEEDTQKFTLNFPSDLLDVLSNGEVVAFFEKDNKILQSVKKALSFSDISIDAPDTIFVTEDSSGMHEFDFYIKNNTEDTIKVKIDLEENFLEGWSSSLCDSSNCYMLPHETELAPLSSKFFDITVYFNSPGEGEVILKVEFNGKVITKKFTLRAG